MSLNITVNSTYKLTSDPMQVIVNRKHIVDPTKSPNWERMKAEGKSGEPRIEWREVAYCRTVEQALNWIAEQTQRDSNAESIAELLGEIQAIRREINAITAK
ncbi:hypothetical protein [Cytobacillus solani]|uniref:Uncharacterized protein n=1 Tax=Cytobacillus solani TaxID=1637975 RepID=A0A0Q3T5Q5_9BACI|nr:hypothetical protein [Cytobacillus solani]KQL18805.1 hypothetical protein AN957_09625 [Cytobacillus solani]